MKPGLTKIAVAATGAALLAGAPSALAQPLPAVNGYNAPSAQIQTQITPNNTPAATTQTHAAPTSNVQAATQTAPAPAHQLPFTGLDVGLAVLAGGVLLALGLGIRRLARPPAA